MSLRSKLIRVTDHLWYDGSRLSVLFLPLSWLYGGIVNSRRRRFLKSIPLPATGAPIVLVVGNISVGGTGKTPLVIYLAKLFADNGYKVGVVLRGYGGLEPETPLQLDSESRPSEVGDEALLIHQEAAVPVVVCRHRQAAVDAIADECTVIISDDGLQHYAMPRHIEIAVLDGARCLGNGWLIPAGPLREPAARLDDVDYVVGNGGDCGRALLSMTVLPTIVKRLGGDETRSLTSFSGIPVRAVAGVGNPQRFFNALASLGLEFEAITFPDHHQFQISELQFDDERPLLMTNKDAIKCATLALSNAWVVQAEAQLPASFDAKILAHVRSLLS